MDNKKIAKQILGLAKEISAAHSDLSAEYIVASLEGKTGLRMKIISERKGKVTGATSVEVMVSTPTHIELFTFGMSVYKGETMWRVGSMGMMEMEKLQKIIDHL
jgi:hypothetical protein